MISTIPFTNNTAGTALENGYLLIRSTTDQCLAFSGIRAYACTNGMMASPPGTTQVQQYNYWAQKYGLEIENIQKSVISIIDKKIQDLPKANELNELIGGKK